MPDTALAPAPSAAAPAPAPAPVAPVAPSSSATAADITEDAIQSALRETLSAPDDQQPAAERQEPSAERPTHGLTQDAQGRWHRADGTFVTNEEAASLGAIADTKAEQPPAAASDAPKPGEQPKPDEATDATAPALPEGVVMPAPAARELAAEFSLKAPDGTELAVPEVLVTFKANGRERTEPLDKVVKLAQHGSYNYEREQQMLATQREIESVRGETAELRAYAEKLEQRYLAVLSDDNAYLADREALIAEQSPERRVARERERLEQEREQMRRDGVARQAETFLTSELGPAITAIANAHEFVGEEEIAARLTLDLHHFQRNGIVPPEQYEGVRQHIVQAILPWVRQKQEERAARFAPRQQQIAEELRQAREQQARAETEKVRAQVEAQQAKRNMARAATPVGRAAAGSAPPPQRTITTAKDAFEDAISSTLDAMKQTATA